MLGCNVRIGLTPALSQSDVQPSHSKHHKAKRETIIRTMRAKADVDEETHSRPHVLDAHVGVDVSFHFLKIFIRCDLCE
jgi:hypothetical protein